MKKKRILIAAYGYFPAMQYGGPPVSIENLCRQMNRDYEIFILTRDHELKDKARIKGINEGWNDLEYCKVQYLSDSNYRYSKICQVVEEIKPSMLYVQTFFAAQIVFPFLWAHRKYSIPLMLCPRGELCRGAFNTKKYKKLPYVIMLRVLGFYKSMFFQATGVEEHYRIRKIIKLDESRIVDLGNFPSVPDNSIEAKKNIIRSDTGTLKIAFLARVHPHKNPYYAIQSLKGVDGDVEYDIYGSIEDKQYWNDCLCAIKELPSNIRVEYKGVVKHSDVHKILSRYDVFLMPTKSENFGHSIVEAMYAGCIPVISDQTPWKDLEANGVGYSLPLNEMPKFTDAINGYVAMSAGELQSVAEKCMDYAECKLQVKDLVEKYKKAFDDIIVSR